MAKKDIKLKAKAPFPDKALKKTKQVFPTASETGAGVEDVAPLTFFFASSADIVQVWGKGLVHKRDRELREFWRSETMLASALFNVCARNAAFEWEIESKNESLEKALTLMFNNAVVHNIRGWIPFITTLSEDYYGTDNGAFIEIIRDESGRLKREEAPVVGISHLDSNRCTRTGNPDIPVVYRDRKGRAHKMPWYSIIPLSEFPSAIETMNGVGFCAVSRVLKHAQIMRNLAIYKDEKVSGRFYRAIHFVGGVSRKEIEDMQNRGEEEADNRGQTRFIMPQIIASLDPEKAVSVATIDLASLPDGFELDDELRWYINGLALGFGVDYQDFAPLPGGNIGSSAQSEILHRKSRGKGPAIFMQTLENVFLYYGVIPTNTTFNFIEKDMFEEAEKQKLRTEQSEELAILVGRGVLRPRDAREVLVKRGFMEAEDIADIPDEYGEDIVAGGNQQLIGSRGSNTIGEDAARTKAAIAGKGILENLVFKVGDLVAKEQEEIVAEEEKTRDLVHAFEGWIEETIEGQDNKLTKSIKDQQTSNRQLQQELHKENKKATKDLQTRLNKMSRSLSDQLKQQGKEGSLNAYRLSDLGSQVEQINEFVTGMNGDEELVISQRDKDGRIKQAVKYHGDEPFEKIEIMERDVDGRAKRIKKEKI